jgi:hypothetical protein
MDKTTTNTDKATCVNTLNAKQDNTARDSAIDFIVKTIQTDGKDLDCDSLKKFVTEKSKVFVTQLDYPIFELFMDKLTMCIKNLQSTSQSNESLFGCTGDTGGSAASAASAYTLSTDEITSQTFLMSYFFPKNKNKIQDFSGARDTLKSAIFREFNAAILKSIDILNGLLHTCVQFIPVHFFELYSRIGEYMRKIVYYIGYYQEHLLIEEGYIVFLELYNIFKAHTQDYYAGNIDIYTLLYRSTFEAFNNHRISVILEYMIDRTKEVFSGFASTTVRFMSGLAESNNFDRLKELVVKVREKTTNERLKIITNIICRKKIFKRSFEKTVGSADNLAKLKDTFFTACREHKNTLANIVSFKSTMIDIICYNKLRYKSEEREQNDVRIMSSTFMFYLLLFFTEELKELLIENGVATAEEFEELEKVITTDTLELQAMDEKRERLFKLVEQDRDKIADLARDLFSRVFTSEIASIKNNVAENHAELKDLVEDKIVMLKTFISDKIFSLDLFKAINEEFRGEDMFKPLLSCLSVDAIDIDKNRNVYLNAVEILNKVGEPMKDLADVFRKISDLSQKYLKIKMSEIGV